MKNTTPALQIAQHKALQWINHTDDLEILLQAIDAIKHVWVRKAIRHGNFTRLPDRSVPTKNGPHMPAAVYRITHKNLKRVAVVAVTLSHEDQNLVLAASLPDHQNPPQHWKNLQIQSNDDCDKHQSSLAPPTRPE